MLTMVTMKTTAFWDVTPCSLLDNYVLTFFWRNLLPQLKVEMYAEDGGNGFLRIVTNYLSVYTASHSREQ
jgi:hypothetical protein